MSDGRKTIKLEITRFDPDIDEVPKTEEYEVPTEPGWKVLDAVNYVKDNVDPSLSHRWSCRMAVCGSCGMMVNGEPKLTCKTSLDEYGDSIKVEPLANLARRQTSMPCQFPPWPPRHPSARREHPRNVV